MIIYDYNEYVPSGDQVVLGKWNEATNKIDFQESEEESEVEDEVEDEVYEVLINGKKYYVDNEVDGCIYEFINEEEAGDKVGKYYNKFPIFHIKVKKLHNVIIISI